MYKQNYNEQEPRHGKSNTGLIVAVSLLSVILIFALIFILLFSTGIISFNSFNAKPTETAIATATPVPPDPPTAPPQVIVVQQPDPPPVNNYYNTYSYNQEPSASVDTNAAESFIEGALASFVNGINTGDTSYIDVYFSSSAADQELRSHKQIRQSVESEEILSLNCYGGEKISDTAATVIRSSTIRVLYKDGSVKDISEKYKYTVSFSGGKMKITGLEEL